MRSEALVLGFDTSAAHCAAALVWRDGFLNDNFVLAERHDAMAKGQAEHLIPMLEDMLRSAGKNWHDLSGIAVGIGPGNFTGIRISVAAARGLALALNIPAIGVSMFEVLAHYADDPESTPKAIPTMEPTLFSLPAPRGQAYVQQFKDAVPVGAARLIDPIATPADLQMRFGMGVSGFAADEICQQLDAHSNPVMPDRIGITLTAVGLKYLHQPDAHRPAPLYVKPADAAPSRTAPPVMLP
ncbi:tRNA (adenosine(37)-N6)-threonylcarbamoyltransferase complex dimerization subunit type 1 TsaB [Puniceibacterium sp. IMCC21224]|uniref:tRNA (adenosine(37)-N6)-threonylcarbamoyltransferase complex dimerization subunit type 1 TsaB n=1 Tax=Puniceibacterium sp. IMCC21224 TaxID=1618204 RepID=UPI00064DD335|nr:tRNA (adenosine(37)-N6)-threonylcarbamoyltransferase complex dimerization subunit type 1 TsaB [Puniceibacterium sp. IMCC21224]KMK66269.1 tRNA threonylcarbamoyl adenosine modification protein YeaZ [Puniceibacterium sp. IMCC21224]